MATERDIARWMANGIIISPYQYMNSTYFKCRFSGTGVAWRPATEQFVWRDPRIWLADDMADRVAGVPLIAEHPIKDIMDAAAFYGQVVGVCVLGYVVGDELWTIVRIIDPRVAQALSSVSFDTSPAVVFAPSSAGIMITTGAGENLLVEDNPALLDHLALIDVSDGNAGVWTKATSDIGVKVEAGKLTSQSETE